jgi:hypothetical protein
MAKSNLIEIKGTSVSVFTEKQSDYISLTDMARYKDSERTDYIIQNWLRNRNTIELLGFWEQLNNPDFNPIEFEGFKKQAGLNSFVLTAKQWIDKTGAIGIISKAGRYGGTFAHRDIAFEFASWISIEFKLYLIKELQRLKEDENNRHKLEWNLQRTLAKVNYHIHTDAIKEKLIPETITPKQASLTYATEADLLNVAFLVLPLRSGEMPIPMWRVIPGSCQHRAIGRIIQPRKHQCRAHSSGLIAKRKATATQPDCHFANEEYGECKGVKGIR